jgi:hypothetical protein
LAERLRGPFDLRAGCGVVACIDEDRSLWQIVPRFAFPYPTAKRALLGQEFFLVVLGLPQGFPAD